MKNKKLMAVILASVLVLGTSFNSFAASYDVINGGVASNNVLMSGVGTVIDWAKEKAYAALNSTYSRHIILWFQNVARAVVGAEPTEEAVKHYLSEHSVTELNDLLGGTIDTDSDDNVTNYTYYYNVAFANSVLNASEQYVTLGLKPLLQAMSDGKIDWYTGGAFDVNTVYNAIVADRNANVPTGNTWYLYAGNVFNGSTNDIIFLYGSGPILYQTVSSNSTTIKNVDGKVYRQLYNTSSNNGTANQSNSGYMTIVKCTKDGVITTASTSAVGNGIYKGYLQRADLCYLEQSNGFEINYPDNINLYTNGSIDFDVTSNKTKRVVAMVTKDSMPIPVIGINAAISGVYNTVTSNDVTNSNNSTYVTYDYSTNTYTTYNYNGTPQDINVIVKAEAEDPTRPIEPDDGGGGGFWDFLKNFTVSVGENIGGVFVGLRGTMGDIGGIVNELFSFMPAPILSMLILTMAIMLFLCILKFFL